MPFYIRELSILGFGYHGGPGISTPWTPREGCTASVAIFFVHRLCSLILYHLPTPKQKTQPKSRNKIRTVLLCGYSIKERKGVVKLRRN